MMRMERYFCKWHLFLSFYFEMLVGSADLLPPGANCSSTASRRTSEFTCLSNSFFFFVRRRTRRTLPSRSGNVSMTRARFHSSLGAFSAMRTTSPTVTFRRLPVHFRRCCNDVTYSRLQRRQNASTRLRTCRQDWRRMRGGNSDDGGNI